MDDSTQSTEPIAKPRAARCRGSSFQAGDVVAGRYRLLETIGRGGFSEVFLAFDTQLSREVAFKILHFVSSRDIPTLSDQQASRFLREARLVAKLDHPHIVPVYDAGVEDGVPWIAMKRILGEALDHRLKAGPVPPPRAIRLLSQIAVALRHAHQKGITHRDLKPANLLVEPRDDGSDHVWLTDFGIAVLRNEAGPERNHVIGTPGYMAPEQITGGPVDERTDIFALGCIAAELITGRYVFTGSSIPEVSDAVLHGRANLAGLDEIAGRRYLDIVKRCLAGSPDERWHTVEVFTQALVKAGPDASPSLFDRFRRKPKPATWDGRFAVQTYGLTKGYRFRRPVIENLDLAIPRGSIYALLGRNGSGKTTLLRTIIGLYRPDRGRVEVFGKDPQREGPAILARLGWIPDELGAEDRMRVRELLDFVAPAYPTWDKPYSYRLLSRFALSLDSRLRELSRGMKTKVSLVMGLSHRPDLIILDDATLGLDAVILDEFVEVLAEVNRQDGSTIILSSHSYEEAERIATHIGVLRDKSMLLSSPLDELKQRIRAGSAPQLPIDYGQELSLREIFVRLLR